MAAAAPTAKRWVFSPAVDLLLGCGLLYTLFFAVFAVAGDRFRPLQPAILLPLLVLFFSAPHYGATLLRVYEQRESRRRYAIFAVYATIAVALVFVAGVHSATIGALMVTIYLTWSPWHYTGQNYGIAMMFLRRRGVPVEPGTKRWVYSTFLLSFLLTFLVMHSADGAPDYALSSEPGGRIHFISLGIAPGITSILVPLVALGYAVSVIASAGILLRRAPLRALVPSLVLVLTQALWFSIPLALQHWKIQTGVEPVDWDYRAYYFMWIAVGHAVQYLWITSYYARSSPGWRGFTPFYLKALASGKAIFVLLILFFSPFALGKVSFDAGLGLLVSAAVNIHHFILDGAIWKLRSSRIGNILIRGVPDPATAATEVSRPGPGGRARQLVWGTCGLALLLGVYTVYEERWVLPAADRVGDVQGLSKSLDRLSRVGQDYEKFRYKLGYVLAERGMLTEALKELQISAELRPSVEAFSAIAMVREAQQAWELALEAYEKARAIDPDRVAILQREGNLLVRMKRPRRALPLLERAVAIDPEHPRSLESLERARAMLEARRSKNGRTAQPPRSP